MATHIVSFRIAVSAGYNERWASVVERIRYEAEGQKTWEETTSFFILRSKKSADALASAIYLGSGFLSTQDTLLVVDVTNRLHATRGKIDDPGSLDSFFPCGLMGNTLLTG